MRTALLGAIVVFGFSGAGPEDAEAEAESRVGRPLVQVRVYDDTATPEDQQAVALGVAAGILASAAIDPRWLSCGLAGAISNPPGCEVTLAPDELAVRLLRQPLQPGPSGRLPMGYSLVDVATATGTLATIFVDRVRWFAAEAGVVHIELLGRAIAHEVGHLLLGTTAHGGHGLMRAVWSRLELQRDNPSDWRFTPAESRAMRQALRDRGLRNRTTTEIVATR